MIPLAAFVVGISMPLHLIDATIVSTAATIDCSKITSAFCTQAGKKDFVFTQASDKTSFVKKLKELGAASKTNQDGRYSKVNEDGTLDLLSLSTDDPRRSMISVMTKQGKWTTTQVEDGFMCNVGGKDNKVNVRCNLSQKKAVGCAFGWETSETNFDEKWGPKFEIGPRHFAKSVEKKRLYVCRQPDTANVNELVAAEVVMQDNGEKQIEQLKSKDHLEETIIAGL